MIEQKKFLEKLISLIESAGVPYAVCGSLSSGLHGQPRATNDADIIIAPNKDQLNNLLKSLEVGYYVSDEGALEAMRDRSMFNVIDNELGWKADLIFRKDSPYELTEFSRRIRTKLMGIDLWILSPEGQTELGLPATLGKRAWHRKESRKRNRGNQETSRRTIG
jgi:hypothetical protein